MGLADDLNPTELVLLDVDAELERQHEKWGDQSHIPWGGSAQKYKDIADAFRTLCDAADANGTVTFELILLEEVYEALAEEDDRDAEKELIQVAAVAAQAVRAIRERRARAQSAE